MADNCHRVHTTAVDFTAPDTGWCLSVSGGGLAQPLKLTWLKSLLADRIFHSEGSSRFQTLGKRTLKAHHLSNVLPY